jgi:hypothetical protein
MNSIHTYPIPRNPNKYNYWGFVSFSALSLFLHALPVSRNIHNMLYSSNVFSLIGFTLIILFYPTTMNNHYGETIQHHLNMIGRNIFSIRNAFGVSPDNMPITARMNRSEIVPCSWVNMYTVNMIGWIAHFIPVYWLSKIYTFGNPTAPFVIYLVLFGHVLQKIYPIPYIELVLIFFASVFILLQFRGYSYGAL